MYSRAQTPTKKYIFFIFFLLAHWYLLTFSYADTKFEQLKLLLKVRVPHLNTATFNSLLSNPRVIENCGQIQFVA